MSAVGALCLSSCSLVDRLQIPLETYISFMRTCMYTWYDSGEIINLKIDTAPRKLLATYGFPCSTYVLLDKLLETNVRYFDVIGL